MKPERPYSSSCFQVGQLSDKFGTSKALQSQLTLAMQEIEELRAVEARLSSIVVFCWKVGF